MRLVLLAMTVTLLIPDGFRGQGRPDRSGPARPFGSTLTPLNRKERLHIVKEKIFMGPEALAKLLKEEPARLTVLQDNPFYRIPPWTGEKGIANGIIEIPKGSRNKYEVDKKTGLVKLDRYLSASCHYPLDYGIIPQTLVEDGDPLDILVICQEPTFSGCLMEARVIGLFHMFEKGVEDYKVLAVPHKDPLQSHVRTLDDVPESFLREVEHFFNIYKQLEGGKIETFGWSRAEDATMVIDETHRRYLEAKKILTAR